MRTANYVFCLHRKAFVKRQPHTVIMPLLQSCTPSKSKAPASLRAAERSGRVELSQMPRMHLKNTVRQFLYRGMNTNFCNTSVNGTKLHSASGKGSV